MKACATLAAVFACCVAACGGQTSIDGTSVSDAGAQDGPSADAKADAPGPESGPDESGPEAAADVVVGPDAAAGFCEGASKIEMAHGMPVEVPVTSGLVAMDCCEAFSLRFHGASLVGMDVEFHFQGYGPIPAGPLFLDGTSTEYNAMAYPVGASGQAWEPVQGTLDVEYIASGDALRVRLCAEVVDPGGLLNGTRMYADWTPVAWWGWDGRFQLRLLADTSIPATDVVSTPLNELPLGVTVLSLAQIAAYDWSDHAISLQGPWTSAASLYAQLPEVSVSGLPFVVTVDDEPVYLGAFTTLVSSVMVPLPTVFVDDASSEDVIVLPPPVGSVDPREDPRVSELMEEAGKLVP